MFKSLYLKNISSVVKVLLKYNADVNSVSDTGQYFINALFNKMIYATFLLIKILEINKCNMF